MPRTRLRVGPGTPGWSPFARRGATPRSLLVSFLLGVLAGGFVKEAMMEVIHERVAGLDVHKDSVVAFVRIMSGAKE
jgi:hypothetical protein